MRKYKRTTSNNEFLENTKESNLLILIHPTQKNGKDCMIRSCFSFDINESLGLEITESCVDQITNSEFAKLINSESIFEFYGTVIYNVSEQKVSWKLTYFCSISPTISLKKMSKDEWKKTIDMICEKRMKEFEGE